MNALILFFISPFISFFTALKDSRRLSSILALVLVGGFIGFLLYTENEGMDLYRYLRLLKSSDTVDAALEGFKTGEEVDLYVPLSVAIIGSFTKNGHILMMWFGLVFGFFYAKSLSMFKKTNSIVSYVFIVVFATIYGYNAIAGVRFATAYYLLFWGVASYMEKHELKSILLIISSSLIHFGMLPGIVVFFAFLGLRKTPVVVYCMALTSFIFTFLDIESIVSQVADMLGGGFTSKVSVYSTGNEHYMNYVKENMEKVVWFIRYRTDAAFYTICAYLSVIWLFRRKIKIEKSTKDYLIFLLVWLTLRNLIYAVPDFGLRYTLVFISLSVYLGYKIYEDNINSSIPMKSTSLVLIAGTLLCPIYAIRQLFDYVSIDELIFSPIYGVISTVVYK